MIASARRPILKTEQIAYWFFRINGCLTITNFLVHHERQSWTGTEVDILAVRFPFRRELAMSTMPMEDHQLFSTGNKIDIMICEVKSGLCDLNGPWTKPERRNMHRVLHAVVAFPEKIVEEVAYDLYKQRYYKDSNYLVRLIAVGMRRNPRLASSIDQLTWSEILGFIYERFKKYRDEKAQHDQWDATGSKLFEKMKEHHSADSFVDDVMKEMGIKAKRKPNWTLDEFELLLSSNQLTDEELARRLPIRSPDAVHIVRNGIHSYHRGMNTSMLSKMMLKRLQQSNGIKCPICGSAI